MENINSYVKKENRGFDEIPFNVVDALVLSYLSYYHYNGLVESLNSKSSFLLFRKLDLSKMDKICSGLLYMKNSTSLIKDVQKSKRYKDLKINYYEEINDENKRMQFSAVSFVINDFCFVSFRGTDSSLLGWREDFDMACFSPVPAQKAAVKYLNKIFKKVSGKVVLGGHSKGGNLAVYAAMNANIFRKHRISRIYNFDGPGFRLKEFNSLNYKFIKNKVVKVVPSSSVFGMVLYTLEKNVIIKSNSVSVFQHNPFSWYVKEDDLVYLKDLKSDSKFIDYTISDWLNNLDDDKKKTFVNTLFWILENDNFNDVIDIQKNWFKFYKKVKNNINKLDADSKNNMDKLLKQLVNFGLVNLKNGVIVKKSS